MSANYRTWVHQSEDDGTWHWAALATTNQDGEVEGHGFPDEASAQAALDTVVGILDSAWAAQQKGLKG